MWQRFMRRLLRDTKITEHDLRGKVGSDLATIERATDLLGHASREITKRHYRSKPEVIPPSAEPRVSPQKFASPLSAARAFPLTHFPANGGLRLRNSQAFRCFKSRVRRDISN